MPCTVQWEPSEKVLVTAKPKSPEKLVEEANMYRQDAEAAMCLLAREVASKDPSILLNLLVSHKSFRKTWKRHQKYDREQGRSYYVFDKKNKQLVFFPAETTSDKE